MEACPFCAESIPADAADCPRCGERLEPGAGGGISPVDREALGGLSIGFSLTGAAAQVVLVLASIPVAYLFGGICDEWNGVEEPVAYVGLLLVGAVLGLVLLAIDALFLVAGIPTVVAFVTGIVAVRSGRMARVGVTTTLVGLLVTLPILVASNAYAIWRLNE